MTRGLLAWVVVSCDTCGWLACLLSVRPRPNPEAALLLLLLWLCFAIVEEVPAGVWILPYDELCVRTCAGIVSLMQKKTAFAG